MKNIKAKWTPWYDLFQNGLSGFGWHSTTNMWIAEDEVWDKLVEVVFTFNGITFISVYSLQTLYVIKKNLISDVEKTSSCWMETQAYRGNKL